MVLPLPRWLQVVADIAVWGSWSVLAGYLGHRMPAAWFGTDRYPFRLAQVERDGRLYRALRIKRWKDRLPEAGAFFAGGFSKRRVQGRSQEYLERFVVETRRAELTHYLVLSIAPLFFLWNVWYGALINCFYGVVANVPCILVQRYNRARLQRVVALRARVGGVASEAVDHRGARAIPAG